MMEMGFGKGIRPTSGVCVGWMDQSWAGQVSSFLLLEIQVWHQIIYFRVGVHICLIAVGTHRLIQHRLFAFFTSLDMLLI